MLKSREKKQSVVRLDAEELDRMAAIQSQLGLSKTGVIRRLIRDFNLESGSVKTGSKFIVDGQISKNIFMQLPIRDAGWLGTNRNSKTSKLEIYASDDRLLLVNIIGYCKVEDMKPSHIEGNYMHDVLYSIDNRMYRDVRCFNESEYDIGDCSGRHIHDLREYSRVEECLNQIFVV